MDKLAQVKDWRRISATSIWSSGRGICLAVVLSSIAALPPAFAQSTPASPGKSAQPELKEPPYEQQLIRLSEILGALHYLRPLCGHDEADEWRQRMYSLLAVEVQNELRRRRLVERFNQSYRSFASVYQTCTPAATEASRRFAGEGVSLTQEVTGKYSRD